MRTPVHTGQFRRDVRRGVLPTNPNRYYIAEMLFFIVLYLVLILGSLSGAGVFILAGTLPEWAAPMQVAFLCALIGGAGGCVYCLRGVYQGDRVKKFVTNG